MDIFRWRNPLTIPIPALVNPIFGLLTVQLPAYLEQFFVDAVIVGSITYVIMPRYVRLIANWLYT
jgi:antibiotic biosynthesis monooxygenase (ABM) superfamily enzyme